MTYERFLKITIGLQRESRKLCELHKLGIDMYDYVDPYHTIINELIREVYGDEGHDWWSWFCWENDFGQKDWSTAESYRMKDDGTSEKAHEKGEPRFGAHDENGNPICYSFESTWEFLEKEYRK